jgi:hypothetical protein
LNLCVLPVGEGQFVKIERCTVLFRKSAVVFTSFIIMYKVILRNVFGIKGVYGDNVEIIVIRGIHKASPNVWFPYINQTLNPIGYYNW